MGSWEEVLLFSMDFTVSPQNFFELVLQDANFCLKKLALAFLTACVYFFQQYNSVGLKEETEAKGVDGAAKQHSRLDSISFFS